MKFRTHNQGFEMNISGGSLRGYVDTTYHRLVEVFGPPSESYCDKSKAEWYVEFEDGTQVDIYDYKEYDKSVEEITCWHVGGKADKELSVKLVAESLAAREPQILTESSQGAQEALDNS